MFSKVFLETPPLGLVMNPNKAGLLPKCTADLNLASTRACS